MHVTIPDLRKMLKPMLLPADALTSRYGIAVDIKGPRKASLLTLSQVAMVLRDNVKIRTDAEGDFALDSKHFAKLPSGDTRFEIENDQYLWVGKHRLSYGGPEAAHLRMAEIARSKATNGFSARVSDIVPVIGGKAEGGVTAFRLNVDNSTLEAYPLYSDYRRPEYALKVPVKKGTPHTEFGLRNWVLSKTVDLFGNKTVDVSFSSTNVVFSAPIMHLYFATATVRV